MTDASAIMAAARARLSAAWPAALDLTGSAHSADQERLPVWRARVEPGDAEPAGMGEAAWLREADLIVEITVTPPAADPEATLQFLGAWVQAVLLGPPADLGLDLLRCDPAGIETDHATGKRQMGSVEITLALQFEETLSAATLPDLT